MHKDSRFQGVKNKIQSCLSESSNTSFDETGFTRESYLDLAEQIVRAAYEWMNDEGVIIDPVEKIDWGQTTVRFVSSAAVLISEGRCEEMLPEVLNAMDQCCERLKLGVAQSPDFWIRELMTAYSALRKIEPVRAEKWADAIRAVIPEQVYWHVENENFRIEELHNWTVYAAAGECMRASEGLAPEADVICGQRFFEKYMPSQLHHFSELGMYRDPGDPLTYDLTTRIQFELALLAGGESDLHTKIDEQLIQGGLMTLLLVSPEGFVPYGGRSSQYHFQEIMVALLCEIHAKRWASTDLHLAGAFKRQARLSLASIQPWFQMTPFRNIKNGFPPESKHGIDPYGKYAVYSLLVASFCVLAAQHADDQIPERCAPSEIGGYVVELSSAFHKVIATCGGSQLVIDTCGDHHYDATGLGRFCHRGVPLALGLGMPLCAEPNYELPEALIPTQSGCIGPEWYRDGQWHRLAALSPDDVRLEKVFESRSLVSFELQWSESLREYYELRDGELSYRLQSVYPIRWAIPLLVHDGERETQIEMNGSQVTIALDHHQVNYHFSESRIILDDQLQANRHGIYRMMIVEQSPSLTIRLD